MTDFSANADELARWGYTGGSACAVAAAGLGWAVGRLPWQLGLLLALVFLFSPNIYSLLMHGTVNLLLADGYTMEAWVEERRFH